MTASPLPPAANRPPSGLLVRLRAETRAAHDRIEALPALSCLLSPALLLPDYIEALRGFWAFHACMHAVLPPLLHHPARGGSATPVGGPDADGLHALAEDLAFFSAPRRPRLRKPAMLTNAASALGGLYVLEGSALGARVIGRAVSGSLGVSPGAGGTFFCGTSADAARQRWQAFCRQLEIAEAGLDPVASGRVVSGALGTFQALAEAIGLAAGDKPDTEPLSLTGATRSAAASRTARDPRRDKV